MSVGHVTSESLHKSGSGLLVSTANEVKAPPLYRPLTAVTGHYSWPLWKNSQRSHLALLYTMTPAIICFEDGYAKWHFHHSDIDFTIRRERKRPIAYLMIFFFLKNTYYTVYIYIFFFFLFCLSAAMGAFRVWIPLLTNKFVWSKLSSSPRGASPPLCLTFPPSFLLTAFIPCLHMHSPNPPKVFHPGWNLQLQKQEPPLLSEPSIFDCLSFVFHKWFPPCLYPLCI